MTSQTPELSIAFNHYELISLVDAMHDQLMGRLFYCISSDHDDFRTYVPLGAVQRSVGAYMALYHRAWNLYIEISADEEVVDEWNQLRTVPDEMWDIVTQVMNADNWSEIAQHDIVHPTKGDDKCVVCEMMMSAMVC